MVLQLASTSGRVSEDDYALTVLWDFDPNLRQREWHNSKSKMVIT